jgi:hypothetical protein
MEFTASPQRLFKGELVSEIRPKAREQINFSLWRPVEDGTFEDIVYDELYRNVEDSIYSWPFSS